MNGVFLVALCLSIFLEAISRFVEPQSVSNPQLVLIVGCFGLVSNILGLVLFHEHGHQHGSHQEQSHTAIDNVSTAEEGRSQDTTTRMDLHTQIVADEGGNVADILPQTTIGGWSKSARLSRYASESTSEQGKDRPRAFNKRDEDESTATNSTSPTSVRNSTTAMAWRHHRRTSGSRSRFGSADGIHIHPASFRNEIIAASRLEDINSATGSESEAEQAEQEEEPMETSPLLSKAKSHSSKKSIDQSTNDNDKLKTRNRHNSWHKGHNHSKPKKDGSGAHGHGDLNMQGIFLHVLGDALGNIGVIGSALIIWLTDYSWRFYADPAISLVITVIILGSALPLCKAASRILLQAVPPGISVDDIKEDIEKLPGILSCHHLHVWQLSDTKLVASLHIQVEYDFKGEGSARYMQLALAVRKCLHEYGIHSSTIQPEFCLDNTRRQVSRPMTDDEGSDTNRPEGSRPGTKPPSKTASQAASVRSEPAACLLECGDECDGRGQCCTPGAPESESLDEAGHSH